MVSPGMVAKAGQIVKEKGDFLSTSYFIRLFLHSFLIITGLQVTSFISLSLYLLDLSLAFLMI